MMNPPLEQQYLAGIEERNDVICRQVARIEELEAALKQIVPLTEDLIDYKRRMEGSLSYDPTDDRGLVDQAQQALKEQP